MTVETGGPPPRVEDGRARSPGHRTARSTRVLLSPARRPLPEPRRSQRRRLLVASAPFVVLLALIGARLVTLNVVHDRTLAAYEAGDRAGTLDWAGRQGWLNLAEPFRAPAAMGSGHVVGGRFDLAQTWFERAFEQVPKGGIDECKVRVNLGLTYERLGDHATERERPDEAKQFYEKGIRVTRERPPVCDAPESGEDTGALLQDAQERMEQKSEGTPSEGGDEPPAPEPSPSAPPQPTPDPQRAPSQEQQDELGRQQRENTAERNRELGSEDRGIPNDQGEFYPRPW